MTTDTRLFSLRRMGSAVAALSLLAAAAVAHATIVVRATVEEMTDLCHRCVVGVVTAETVALDQAVGAITTTWTVRVDESWVGDAVGEVAITAPGGTVGTLSQELSGAARLSKGQRVVAFLWKDQAGRLQVLGEAQGAFRVERNPASGEDICQNSTAGLSLVDRAGKATTSDVTQLRLTDFRDRVDAARKARVEREKRAAEARAAKLEAMRIRAEALAEKARGRPGAAPE